MKVSEVIVKLCDVLNPSIGYEVKIVSKSGETLLHTARNPSTGKDLTTLSQALTVASYYAKRSNGV